MSDDGGAEMRAAWEAYEAEKIDGWDPMLNQFPTRDEIFEAGWFAALQAIAKEFLRLQPKSSLGFMPND